MKKKMLILSIITMIISLIIYLLINKEYNSNFLLIMFIILIYSFMLVPSIVYFLDITKSKGFFEDNGTGTVILVYFGLMWFLVIPIILAPIFGILYYVKGD